jgi:hypothetical protein
MFSSLELSDLFVMTVGTCIRRGDPDFIHIVGIHVLVSMTYSAVHLVLTVFADLPIRNDIRRDILMACDTFLGSRTRPDNENAQENKYDLTLQLFLPYP